MTPRWIWLGLILAALSVSLCPKSSAAAELPNVVIIYIDDMGYADIGPFGAQGYATPNLDRMAREGRIFTDFYVAQAVCSASRAALMTGCYNVRVGILGALAHQANHGIHAAEMTLAEVVKQKGYATACYGKWHLGHHPKFLPTNHGFDEYLGLPYSNDMWPFHPTAGIELPRLAADRGHARHRRRSDRRRSGAVDDAIHAAGRAVHREEQGSALLRVPAAQHGPCASARVRQVPRQEPARACSATS